MKTHITCALVCACPFAMKTIAILLALALTIFTGCAVDVPETSETVGEAPDAICSGCMYRGVCFTPTPEHCGNGGEECRTCHPGDCQVGYCLDGDCAILVAPDGDGCGGSGICTAGTCSTGCNHWTCSNLTCHIATSVDGQHCNSTCQQWFCNGTNCASVNAANGTACGGGGTCSEGVCI